MPRYPLGQPLRLTTTVKDLGGTLVNAGAITLHVQRPDLTVQAYASPTNPSTGTYYQDVPAADLAQVGHYQYKWVSTGTGAGVSHDEFDVFDPFDVSVLSLQSAKEQLNISTTASDAELAPFVDACVEVVERFVGAVAPRTVSEVAGATSDLTALRLRTVPLVSLTSMTQLADGVTAYTVADLYVANGLAGIVRRRDGGALVGGPWTVVYTAGRAQVPPSASLACQLFLQHLWETRRGLAGAPRVAGAEPTTVIPGIGYAVPNRVLELLEGKRLPPMVA